MSTELGRPIRSNFAEPATGLDTLRELRWPRAQHETDAPELRAMFETSPHPTLVADSEGRIRLANPAAARLLHIPVEELQGTYLHDCMTKAREEDAVRLGCMSKHGQLEQLEVRLADGRVLSASQRTLKNGWELPAHVCVELEERREPRATQTLDLLGRLAGELAHDINNQLSAALNYIFVLQRRLGRSEELLPHLTGLHGATWHAAMLADGLRLMARKRSATVEELDLHAVVAQVAPMLRHLAPDSRIDVRIDAGLPRVRAPLAYVEQLLVALTQSALRRAATERDLVVRAVALRQGDGPMKVRLSCELLSQPASGGAVTWSCSPAALRKSHHGALRRAIKRCGVHMGHDARRIWVDFSEL